MPVPEFLINGILQDLLPWGCLAQHDICRLYPIAGLIIGLSGVQSQVCMLPHTCYPTPVAACPTVPSEILKNLSPSSFCIKGQTKPIFYKVNVNFFPKYKNYILILKEILAGNLAWLTQKHSQ